LVLFIFSKSNDKTDLKDNDENNELVEESQKKDSNNLDSSENRENEKDKEEQSNDSKADTDNENSKNESDEEEPNEEEPSGEETIVSENDAPHDPEHNTDYNGGSADRVAIKEEIMKVTGLGSNLIEYWVGNNGPGRVSATVASSDQSEIYEVHLQYGDGRWQVTDYKALDSVPNNFD
ncbi:MAG: YrrS family protein, partial [Atopostipes suicloacalis]|nr:YrrS family protein [Atopostipes suicloacalis]